MCIVYTQFCLKRIWKSARFFKKWHCHSGLNTYKVCNIYKFRCVLNCNEESLLTYLHNNVLTDS